MHSDLRVVEAILPSVCASDDLFFFFSSRRRHTRCSRDWSSDVCSSDLSNTAKKVGGGAVAGAIIGAIAGGGKGAAIGAGVGSAAGAGVQVLTKGQQVKEIGRASCRERV